MGRLLSTHSADAGRRRVLGRVHAHRRRGQRGAAGRDVRHRPPWRPVRPRARRPPAADRRPRRGGAAAQERLAGADRIYEHGLAHHFGGVRREWTWDQVEAVDVANLGCTIRFSDGALLHFTGQTENSRTIVAALDTHCPAAASVPVRKTQKARAAAVLGGITLAGGGVATWATLTVSHTPDGGDQF